LELQKAVEILSETHKNDLHFDLEFSSPYELLIAALLAAQASDESVNEITKGFFPKFPSAQAVAEADVETLSLSPCFHSARGVLSQSSTLMPLHSSAGFHSA